MAQSSEIKMNVNDVAEIVVEAYGKVVSEGRWGININYLPTDKIIEKAKEYTKTNTPLAQEIAKFVLYEKYSPQSKREKDYRPWRLKPENATLAIELFSEAGMSVNEIVDELIEASKGRTPFNTIEKYVEGISPYKDAKKQKFREVYSKFYKKLPEAITPKLINQAADHIILTKEDYGKIKPATSGYLYRDLEIMKKQIEDGIIENKIKNELGKKCEIDKIKYWINNVYYGKGYSNNALKWFIHDVSCLLQVIEEFENELNSKDFKEKYAPVKNKIISLKTEGELLHESINSSLDALEQKLIQEYKVK